MTPMDPVPPLEPAAVVVPVTKGWIPTRKWIAAQVVALGALAGSAVESGWSSVETKLLIGIVVQALVTYLLANDLTPGGVPDATPKLDAGQGLVEVAVFLLIVIVAIILLLRFL